MVRSLANALQVRKEQLVAARQGFCDGNRSCQGWGWHGPSLVSEHQFPWSRWKVASMQLAKASACLPPWVVCARLQSKFCFGESLSMMLKASMIWPPYYQTHRSWEVLLLFSARYEDGKFKHKKNTFTDFIAAAEHLINKKYTNKSRLCIQVSLQDCGFSSALTDCVQSLKKPHTATFKSHLQLLDASLTPKFWTFYAYRVDQQVVWRWVLCSTWYVLWQHPVHSDCPPKNNPTRLIQTQPSQE